MTTFVSRNNRCDGLEVGSLVGVGIVVGSGFEVGAGSIVEDMLVVSLAAQPMRIRDNKITSIGCITRFICVPLFF